MEGDILDLDPAALMAPPWDLVANLPYHVTSPILHRMLGTGPEAAPRPERLVLMVQREVADRIAAPPGKMSYLSAFVQYHAAVRIALAVPPAAFYPPPEVDSAIILLEMRPSPPVQVVDEQLFFRVVRGAFAQRRKTLRNTLAVIIGAAS